MLTTVVPRSNVYPGNTVVKIEGEFDGHGHGAAGRAGGLSGGPQRRGTDAGRPLGRTRDAAQHLQDDEGRAPQGIRTRRRNGRPLEGHDFSRWRVGQRRWVAIAHPDDIDHVLLTNRENYPKSSDYEPLRGVLGLSLFTDDDPSWSRHRKMINPKFQKRYVDALLPLMLGTVLDFRRDLDDRPRRKPGRHRRSDDRLDAGGRGSFDVQPELPRLLR